MSASRTVTLILSLAAIALTVVVLRWEQTRLEAGLLRAETRWSALRRDWWSVQSTTAMLKTPARVRRRTSMRPADWGPLADTTSEYARYADASSLYPGTN